MACTGSTEACGGALRQVQGALRHVGKHCGVWVLRYVGVSAQEALRNEGVSAHKGTEVWGSSEACGGALRHVGEHCGI